MIIGIRADGSKSKGMGHIMRCIAIATEFKNRGIDIIFITKEDKSVKEILINNNIKNVTINSNDLDDEIEEVVSIIKKYNINYIMTDSYWLNYKYLLELRMNVEKLICIDDNNICAYPSNIIINGNIYAQDLNYDVIYEDTKLLLGSKYTILRDEFRNNNEYKIIKKSVENILITMGGSDINNFTPIVIESLIDLNLKLNVIIGPSFSDISELEKIYSNNLKVNFIKNPKNLKEIMLKCDIAICAAGSTSYELASLGIPTILIQQAKNQANICSKMSELGIAISLGDFSNITKEMISKEIISLIENYDLRIKMNSISKKQIFRDGIKNIVDEILNDFELK